jgi:hypothetical protein
MVDAQPGIAAESVAEILPERIDALFRMQQPDGVRPAHGDEFGIRCANLRPKQGIVLPALRLVNVEVGRHHVEIANQSHRHIEFEQFSGVGLKTLEPAEFVIELRPWCWMCRQIASSKECPLGRLERLHFLAFSAPCQLGPGTETDVSIAITREILKRFIRDPIPAFAAVRASGHTPQ